MEHNNLQNLPSFIKGTCLDMCPKEEENWRKREGLIHVLETNSRKEKPHYNREVVKCFHRSAAGQKAPQPSDLRPASVLIKTVNYLLTSVVMDDTVRWSVVYNFVFDRLRAVRQDVVIQGLGPSETVAIFEPIVRFHVYAGYRLCEEPPANFDATINNTHLRECLKRLLSVYDDDGDESTSMTNSRAEMEALHLLLNLRSWDAFTRAQNILQDFRLSSSHLLMKMIEICLSWWNGNYVRVLRLYSKLPPLLACAASFQLPQLRRHAFQVMSTAYHSRNCIFPLENLQKLLFYSSKEDLIKDCSHYGVSVNGDNISFMKGNFKQQIQQCCMRHEGFIDLKIHSLDLPKLLLPEY